MAAVKKASKATWENVTDVRHELEKMVNFKLGSDELRILLRVARRLSVGFERYGAMRVAKDKRDYQKEAFEEILDWLVYTEMDAEKKAQTANRKRRRT